MAITDEVVTLLTGKALKTKGVIQSSLYVWISTAQQLDKLVASDEVGAHDTVQCGAFTARELGTWLPLGARSKLTAEGWEVSTGSVFGWISAVNPNEAEARGQVLLLLLTKNMVSAETLPDPIGPPPPP